MWRTGTGLHRARQRTQRDDDGDRNHRGPRNGWFLCFTFFLSLSCSSRTVRLQMHPQPDLLHERSYRTCFEPDNPRRRTAAPVPTHPHLHGCQEGIINPATSTFRLVLGGATLLSTRTLVAVLSAHWWWGVLLWLALRMLTSFARRLALPLMVIAPHPPAVVLLCTQYLPSPATHATTPSDDQWSLRYLLFYCVPVWPALQSSSPYIRHLRVDRLESMWHRSQPLAARFNAHTHIRTCRHIEVVWLHRGSMLEARPSSGAVQLPAYTYTIAARSRWQAWLLLRSLLLPIWRGWHTGERGDNSSREALCSMQINYPPHHRGRFWSLLHALLSTCFSLGQSLGGPASSTQPSRQLPWVEVPAPAGPAAKVEFEEWAHLFSFRRPIAG